MPKLNDSQIKDDFGAILNEAVNDTIVPGLLQMFGEIGHNAVDRLLYHGARPSRGRTGIANKTYYNYTSSSKNPTTTNKNTMYATTAKDAIPNGLITVEDLFLENRADADMVIDQLRDVLDDYPVTTVSDMQEFLKNIVSGYDNNPTRLHPKFTDSGYGWDNLSEAKSVRLGNGYYTIALPKPKKL